jgi:predicted transcriptional regulator
MRDEIDYSSYVPEDLLREIEEYEEQYKKTGRRRKNYPSSRDIVEAVREAALKSRGIHPDDFPRIVIETLKDKGFDTELVTVKRVWRIYEKLVRTGVIPDTLGVLAG